MPAERLDGAAVAAVVRAEVAQRVGALRAHGVTPGLTVVIVGEDPASQFYVASKEKAALEAGIAGRTVRLSAATPQAELLALVDRLNDDPTVHGILVQMPLPRQLDAGEVLRRIDPDKDVDGFHPVNVGRLSLGDPAAMVPCTPLGVMRLLAAAGVSPEGRDAVVIGRSTIVGRPMAALLVNASATVTVCHSRTRDLVAHARRADILVAAIGRPEFVTADMVKPGATVIDVGINRVDDPSMKKGYRIVGDVEAHGVAAVAGRLTPVPGGVGPMTIAMLLQNTVTAAERTLGRVAVATGSAS